MNELEISFGFNPWEAYLDSIAPGGTVSAVHLLTLMEGEEDETVEEALQALQGKVKLDISGLPMSFSGDAAQRLHREQELVRQGLPLAAMDPADPLFIYLNELASIPACGDEELLAQECAQGEESAREKLLNLGISRVVQIAGEYTGYGVLMLDLIQEGNLGLWEACCTYAEGDYAAHADAHIRFAIAKAVLLQSRSNGTADRLRRSMEDYRQVDEQLLTELGRNPTLEEIAEAMHIRMDQAENIRKAIEDVRSLARVRRVPDEEEEKEAQEQAVEDTARFQSRQRILDLLSGVSEIEGRLLTLRFGLEGGRPLTPEEAGRKLGLSPEEVVAKEAAALAKLRNA